MIIYNNDFFQCDRFFSFKFQFHEKTSTVISLTKKTNLPIEKKLKITKKRILTVKNGKNEFMLGQPKNN